MTFSEFDHQFEISVLVGNYKRGDKLQLLTSQDKENRIDDIINRFREKGLL